MKSALLPVAVLVFFMTVLTLPVALTAQQDDEEFPDAGFFVGSYTLIGTVLEGNDTFMGLLVLEMDSAGTRTFERIIAADTVRGSWGIEYAIGAEVRVIRTRWQRDGRRFECTYQWCYDFDSYARLTGHCYESGLATDIPGMEAGFAIWPEWGNPDTLLEDEK